MQSEKTLLDDLARFATGAAGALGDVKEGLEARLRELIERILARMDLPTREEQEAVRAMAAAARDENERLAARVAELEARLEPKKAPEKPRPRRKVSPRPSSTSTRRPKPAPKRKR